MHNEGRGYVGRTAVGPTGRLLDGAPFQDCYPFGPPTLRVFSRLLEDTFRNGVVNTKSPSLLEPPFQALPIDEFPDTPVTIPGGTYGAGTPVTVAAFTLPRARYRGIITHVGQSAENAAAFADLSWRIAVNGLAIDPWIDVRIQLWEMAPPTMLCTGVQLRAGDTVAIQASSLSLLDHFVLGRICGWFFPVRSESGDEIRSTFVD